MSKFKISETKIEVPTFVVGLESTLDAWVTFPTISSLKRFSGKYRGGLREEVKKGYELVSGDGGEIPIDGKSEEAHELLELAKKADAEICYSLGGNGAQETAALRALGANVIFLGSFFPHLFTLVPEKNRAVFQSADLSFALPLKHEPVSVILQASGTNRCILCDGQGRRIAQLRSYLKELPKLLHKIMESRRVDMVNLVGWHVIFANGLKKADLEFVEGIIEQIKKVVHAPIFTDAGSVLKLKKCERRRLFQIYSLFDILSLNEDELRNLGRSLELREGNEFLLLYKLMKAGSFKTIWLHTHEYQAGLSATYDRRVLESAQKTAAAAGACRVEKGGYPTLDEIKKKLQSEAYTKLSTQMVKKAVKLYGEKIRDVNFVVTPAYVKKRFASTVGAGDVSAAAYTYVLASKK